MTVCILFLFLVHRFSPGQNFQNQNPRSQALGYFGKRGVGMRFSRASKSVESKWFLGVRCRKCSSPILFAQDRSEGEGALAPLAKLVLTCSQAGCGAKADYSGAAISRFQNGPQ
jgi:hypothetical protein